MANVIKRDGSKEPFKIDNIVKIAKAAGCSESEAQIIAGKMGLWISEKNSTDISVKDIREKFLSELLLVNQNAADLYRWYESTKDEQTEDAKSANI